LALVLWAAAGCKASAPSGDGPARASPDADTRRCGPAAKDCLGGACADGLCQPVVVARSNKGLFLTSLATDGSPTTPATRLLWTATIGGYSEVTTMVLGDPSSQTVLSDSGATRVSALAFDSDRVYWGVILDPLDGIRVVSRAGGKPTDLIPETSAVSFSLASDGKLLTYGDDEIRRIPVGGGPPVTLTKGARAGQFVVDGDTIAWVDRASLSATGESNKDAAVKVLVGGVESTLSSVSTRGGESVALDGQYVYWSDGAGLRRAPRAGGPVTDIGVSPTSVRSLAADDRYVYWIAEDATLLQVMRVEKAGGTAEALVFLSSPAPCCLVVDDRSIFYSDGSEVSRLAK
jgi:hypothetical protein